MQDFDNQAQTTGNHNKKHLLALQSSQGHVCEFIQSNVKVLKVQIGQIWEANLLVVLAIFRVHHMLLR